MDIFTENRQKARQIFLDSPVHDPGTILTGNVGEVNFTFLPQVEGEHGEYLVARWAETCYRAGPSVTWLEYGMRLNFWFRGEPLKFLARESSSRTWQTKEGFDILDDQLSFFIRPEGSHQSQFFRLDQGQLLPAVKQGEGIWLMDFAAYYGHHFASVSVSHKITIDLAKMEVRNLFSISVDLDD